MNVQTLAAATLCMVGAAYAEPPANTAPPITIGAITAFGTEHSMVSTSDGATWIVWLDTQCFGSIRLQRIDADGSLLVPGGVELSTLFDCALPKGSLAACDDGSVVALGVGSAFPVQRVSATGEQLWGSGVVVSPTGPVVGALAVPGGDVLLAWDEGATLKVGRFDVDGLPVWTQPTSIPSNSNKRIFAMLTDDAGGAFVLWDAHGSYTKAISMTRVHGDGQVAWGGPFVVVPMDGPPSFSGSSRHTDPVAVADGNGGVVLVWTFGAETGTTPVPLLMQHVNADGERLLEPEGRRIALQGTRQFNVSIARDDLSGDVLVGWRDGFLPVQELRAQRMTTTGTRLWGDHGVSVTPIGIGNLSHYDVTWRTDTMSLFVSELEPAPGEAGLHLHRIAGDGALHAETCALSSAQPAGMVHAVQSPGQTVVSWAEGVGYQLDLQARQLDGLDPQIGDTNGDGLVNVDDLVNVILDWGTDGAAHGGDVNGDGDVDVDDLVTVILEWTA